MKKWFMGFVLFVICVVSTSALAAEDTNGYAIETNYDKCVQVYSVIGEEQDERNFAMQDIMQLTGDPAFNESLGAMRAVEPWYQNGQQDHGSTTAYSWKRLHFFEDYFNYVFEGGQSAMWTGSGNCDKIILFENISVNSTTKTIAWPFSVGASTTSSSASWSSEPFTGTNVAGASYSNFRVAAAGTLSVTFVDGADIYKGSIIRRPMVTIAY